MLEEPYWKRLIDEATRARPDLAYKFKSPAQAAASSVQPGSPAAPEAPAQNQSQPDAIFNQDNVIPATHVNPFEVRLVFNDAGMPTHIRCYKGVISDYQTGKMSSNSQAAIPVPKRTSKRIKINVGGGSSGIVGADQKDFMPSNYDPGPEQFKYSEYNDPTQTTFVPDFTGVATSGGVSSGVDQHPEPDTTTQTYGTGGYPYGKDTFTTNTTLGAYFEWSYSDGAMVRLFCKNASDPETRAWGVWGNSGLPTDLGDDGFFILIAQISGGRVLQFFSSDVIVLGGGGGENIHPFKLRKNMTTADPDTTVWEVTAGTLNNIVPSNMTDTFYLVDGESVWIKCDANSTTYEYPSAVSIGHGVVMPDDDDDSGYLRIAKRVGADIQQYVTGSLWSDRIKLGTQTAKYFYARI